MMAHPNSGAWVWPAAMIVWGPGFTSARHSHHCDQLVMEDAGQTSNSKWTGRSMENMWRCIGPSRRRS